jgi:hypothetical protein
MRLSDGLQTYYSSFLLGIVVHYAFIKSHWIAYPYVLVYGTSILHHAKYFEEYPGKHVLITIDRVLVHVMCASMFYVALTLKNIRIVPYSIFWCGISWMYYLYYIGKQCHLPGTQWIKWHTTLHAASTIGMICLLSHF